MTLPAPLATANPLDLFRVVVESAPNAIVVADGAGEIKLLNPLAERMFGYQREELLGESIDILVPVHARHLHPRRREAYSDAPVARNMGEGRDLTARRKDGTEFPVEIGLSPAQTADGLFVVTMITDITERKQLEMALRKARELAEEASRAKGSFLASMSHEIRTPMNGIIGMANLLAATELDEEQREYATTIVDSADCLLTILNDVLDYSKIEAGRLLIESREFDLQSNVEGAGNLLAARAKEKGLLLKLDYPGSLPRRFVGDGGRIRQILLNLLGNALKFTSQGEVAVSVNGQPDGQGWSITVSVEDTGIGIPPASLAALFQEFVQADETTARKFGGTGLGLAISQRLAELMGGKIRAASELGKGSRFWLTLPLRSADPPIRA